jgi:hypothetical protein
MEVGQGPNWGCSAKKKKKEYVRPEQAIRLVHQVVMMTIMIMITILRMTICRKRKNRAQTHCS